MASRMKAIAVLLCSIDARLLARVGISGPVRHSTDGDAKKGQGCLSLCLSKNEILPVHERSKSSRAVRLWN